MIGDGFKALAKLNGSIEVGGCVGDKTDVSVHLSSPMGSSTIKMRVPTDTVNDLDITSAVYGAEKTHREFGVKSAGKVYMEHALQDDRMTFPSVDAINEAIAQGNQNGDALREVLTDGEIESIVQLLEKDILDEDFDKMISLHASVDTELAAALEKIGNGGLEFMDSGESLDEMMSAKEAESRSYEHEQAERAETARGAGAKTNGEPASRDCGPSRD